MCFLRFKDQWLIQWQSNGRSKWVKRLNLLFRDESRTGFRFRLQQARRRQEEVGSRATPCFWLLSSSFCSGRAVLPELRGGHFWSMFGGIGVDKQYAPTPSNRASCTPSVISPPTPILDVMCLNHHPAIRWRRRPGTSITWSACLCTTAAYRTSAGTAGWHGGWGPGCWRQCQMLQKVGDVLACR